MERWWVGVPDFFRSIIFYRAFCDSGDLDQVIGRHTESLTGPTRALFVRFLRQTILTTESPTGPVNILERKYYGTDRAKMGPFHNIYVP